MFRDPSHFISVPLPRYPPSRWNQDSSTGSTSISIRGETYLCTSDVNFHYLQFKLTNPSAAGENPCFRALWHKRLRLPVIAEPGSARVPNTPASSAFWTRRRAGYPKIRPARDREILILDVSYGLTLKQSVQFKRERPGVFPGPCRLYPQDHRLSCLLVLNDFQVGLK